MDWKPIHFFVNGARHTVSNDIHPATRLSDYLRQVARLKGTKVMCREGGCGACVVSVQYTDPITGRERARPINSCLCPITIARGWHITTTEGLGSQQNGFHPIQQRMADYSATQCGYCTPGFVMSAYGTLKDNPDTSCMELEKALDGNLCRCTGYRAIIDVSKSITKDGGEQALDIEELSKLRCLNKNSSCKSSSVSIQRPESHKAWQRPQSVEQLLDLMEAHKDKKTRLVFGNTATGVFKGDRYQMYLDLRDIDELYKVEITESFLQLGSNITLTDLQELCRKYQSNDGFEYLNKLADFIDLIANRPIRNAGTWAGNLILQHDHPEFPSDIFTPFECLGAEIQVASKSGVVKLTPSQLLSEDMQSKVIVSVKLPALGKEQIFQIHKVMPRNQSAHSYVNGAFSVSLDKTGSVIADASIVFCGLGPQNNHAVEVEEYLRNKSCADSTCVASCIEVLEKFILVTYADPLVSDEYRKNLARNLLYKFLCSIFPNGLAVPPVKLTRPAFNGMRVCKTSPDQYPIGQPIPKLSGKLQASGELQYVDDMPKLEGELVGVLVLSTIGRGDLDKIDTTAAMTVGGAVDIVTAKDIPGDNLVDTIQALADKQIEYHGQPVALVLAGDVASAYRAASMVKITYKNVERPIVDIDEAISKRYFHMELPAYTTGNTEEALKDCPTIIEGRFGHESQYYFFLENEACLCVPREQQYDIWSSTQHPDFIQASVARNLAITSNRIHLTAPRLGGGFGGKCFYPGIYTSICAVAASKTKRPVRLVAGLDTCMKVTGRRPDIRATYKIGLDSNNTIKGIVADVYWNCGHRNYSRADYFIDKMVTHMDSLYFIPNWTVNAFGVKTDRQKTHAMRGPSQLPASLIGEHMMEHAAWVVGEDPFIFKQRHLYRKGQMMLCKTIMPEDNIQELWQSLNQSADIQTRQADIQKFNKVNRWMKRGLAISPGKYIITYTKYMTYPVYVAVYHHDGSVIISHGGVEMGQGLHTKVVQVAAKTLEIPMDLVTTYNTNSLTGVNTAFTAASQTAEYICRTVQECCQILLERLDPIKKKFPDADWAMSLKEAQNAGINMAVSQRHVTESMKAPYGSDYNVYGVMVAEAEVDILTGQSQILRADIHMDIGQSVNPEIDFGQIEGALGIGLGLMFLEKDVYDKETGKLLTGSTWDYKPPTSGDVPADLRITLMADRPNTQGVFSSKAVGEPPICTTPAFLNAVKAAIASSRLERGKTDYFDLFAPATPQVIQKACDVRREDLAA